ncbi:hypothetical protein ElyMa_004871500 [Elysia marginata]|uniref:Uncharacterized protein n=1 Tax=Elysia marginata TaxID=1093978 RepID=A0AAV4IW29_9GAST|nr:hypothetical protein ElyMa_004871500 [Elysia marginata]
MALSWGAPPEDSNIQISPGRDVSRCRSGRTRLHYSIFRKSHGHILKRKIQAFKMLSNFGSMKVRVAMDAHADEKKEEKERNDNNNLKNKNKKRRYRSRIVVIVVVVVVVIVVVVVVVIESGSTPTLSHKQQTQKTNDNI